MFGYAVPPAEEVALSSYFGEGGASSCVYEYDFGDGWLHDVKLVRVVERPERFRRRLLAGKRAFPPEDCGGLGGYQRCVEFLKTGRDDLNDDPEGFAGWLGDWKPEGFNLEAAKARFDRPRPGRPKKPKKPAQAPE
jgi:hypothetical protein